MQPQVIFLDAVGTLFGVRGSVGDIYAQLAQGHGVAADPATLDQAFFRAFRAATPMAFPHSDPAIVPAEEYAWWRVIAQQTFNSAGVLDHFADFDAYFADLYNHFATAEPWFLYPDTLASLQRWQKQGRQLGVISNFDSRLYAVLDALDLTAYFQSITISTEVGAAKPDPSIFAVALEKHGCFPEDAVHVGDSQREDFEGAKAAGLQAVWLQREG